MCSTYLSIDIPFSTPVVTSDATGIILRTVIEFLAYYKKQIPFPYDTFRLMTAKIQTHICNESSSDDLQQMQMERQQLSAIDTFKSFKVLLEVSDVFTEFNFAFPVTKRMYFQNVTEQLAKTEFRQALILFGATSLTPKEAFLINIPPITKYHHSINHQESIQRIARSITM